MKPAYIKAISYFLPEKVVTNADLAKEFPDWSIDKIAAKIGINSRHIAAENETSVDLAVKASEKLFSEHNIDKSTIDFVILCTQSPDYFLPTSACIIQDKLGLSTSVGAFDINLGCSGYVYGLSIAKGFISANIGKNILLITAETYSKYIHPKDKSNRSIFGDASSATLVSSSNGFAEIGNFSFGTDGSGAENLIIKTGCSRNFEKTNDLTFDENGAPISSDYLYMNGAEIFNFTLSKVPLLIDNILTINSLTKPEINLFIFHQANRYLLNFLRKKIKIEEELFFYFLEEVGNTVSSTIPIAISEAYNQNKLNGNIVLAGFGVGYSWGGLVLKTTI